jgi:hypothetical protein
MDDDDDDDYLPDDFDPALKRRDKKIDEAKVVLLSKYFSTGAATVYYGRQLEIALEETFYHWITKKALNELAAERKIQMSVEASGDIVAHMYFPRGYRYARRQIGETLKLIAEFSDSRFTRALGGYGEMLADVGFADTGFRVRGRNVTTVGKLTWNETKHNLDRLVERDGERYGVEIKNQLGYIDQTEFQIKLAMCKHFKIRPLFIARMMPRSYIYAVQQEGGFCLILENQHYPLLADDLASRVRAKLKLPVRVIRALPDTTFRRFERWHEGGHAPLKKRPSKKP